MSSDTKNKLNNYSKMTNETLKSLNDGSKRTSDSALKREKDKEYQDINLLLKSEIKEESDGGTLNPYDNTPSKKANKLRAFSLTNSAHSAKLLEKLVQGQSDNEFTRATLAYQETSLKLLEEIKNGIGNLQTGPSSPSKETVTLEREVSSLATAIAKLDIPALFKELKSATIKTFDKNGYADMVSLFYETISSVLGDRDSMKNMIKGRIKNATLSSMFGRDGAHFISKFEEDPVNAIQDYINSAGAGKNQFLRALFGKNVRGIEIKKPSSSRSDMEDVKSLNDKLTYNTINYRLPETLDRILAAISGEEKKSYDYATNTYATDYQRLNQSLSSGKLIDIRQSSEEILSAIKDNIEDLFSDGKISTAALKENILYDETKRQVKRDARGRVMTNDDEALSAVMLEITKSRADLNMLRKASIEKFIDMYNIKPKNIPKGRVVRALQMLQQMINQSGTAFIDETDQDIYDIREKVSNMDFMDTAYAGLTDKQADALSRFRRNEITKDEFLKIIERSSKGSGVSGNRHAPAKTKFGNLKYVFKDGTLIPNDLKDIEKSYSAIEDVINPEGNASGISIKGIRPNESKRYQNKINYLIKQGILTEYDISSIGSAMGNVRSNITFDDATKKKVDDAEIKFAKATEIFNMFFDSEMTPIQLEAKTGQSMNHWIKQGFPTRPADLYKYIKVGSDGEVDVDYTALSKINVNFTKDYIDTLQKRYKFNNHGNNVDVTDPGKTLNGILNETFRDPEVNRRLGIKSGSAAGFVLGKLMLDKGMISSPYMPYLMGGIGGAIMNMESVQKRINAIFGPEGDIKGESGYTNREIALAKFMTKALPAIGAGGYVAKNVMRVFKGTGVIGSGLGILSGGTLGLITGLVAPKLMDWGREKLFGDDGEGNKGFIKGIGSALRNIPWVEKYLGMSTRAGDTDEMIMSQTLGDLVYDLETEIRTFEGKTNLSVAESKQLNALKELKSVFEREKKTLLSDKSSIKRKPNESPEEFKERLKDYYFKKIQRFTSSGEKRGNQDWVAYGEDLKKTFIEKFEKRNDIRDKQRETGRNISDYSIDFNIKQKQMYNALERVTDPKQKAMLKEILDEAYSDKGEGNTKSFVNSILNVIDPEGKKKEGMIEFSKFLNEKFFGDGDYAAINTLSNDEIEYIKSGDMDRLMESISKDEDKMSLFSELLEMGNLSENFMDDSDLALIRQVARLQALATTDENDPSLEFKTDQIMYSLIKALNRKGFDYTLDKKVKGFFGGIKEKIGKFTGDTGIMDGEDREAELELLERINSSGILKNDKFKAFMSSYDEKRQKERLEEAALEEEARQNESGSGSVKMKDLRKYSFKDGRTLDITGCSVATLNNMLVSMGYGSLNIKDLIKIANKYLLPDGSVSATFYQEIAKRMGLKLTKYSKADGTLTEDIVNNSKPSKSKGIILLKINPGMNYGHFVEWCKPTKINDPEQPGLTTVSIGDILLMSDMMLVFERSTESIKSGSGSTSNSKSGSFTDKVANFATNFIANKVGIPTSKGIEKIGSISGTGESVSNSEILDVLKNGIINVRLVDDLMLPLKVSDGKMSKYIGDKRLRTKDNFNAYTKLYDKAREADAFKDEFAKADAVQDAILNGFMTSGAGTGAAGVMDPNAMGNTSMGGGIGSVIAGLAVPFLAKTGKNLLSKSSRFLKNIFKKKTSSIYKNGISKTVRDKMAKNMAKEIGQETAEKSIFKHAGKLIPKISATIKLFFGKIFEKAPKFMQPYLLKMSSKVFSFADDFAKVFMKFCARTKSIISKKLALGTAKSIPLLNVVAAIMSFTFSAISGYREASELLGKEEKDTSVLEKAAVGFAKGSVVALPGFIVSCIPAIGGFLSFGLELFMEEEGFRMLMNFFINSQTEEDTHSTEKPITPQDIEKAEAELESQEIDNIEVPKITQANTNPNDISIEKVHNTTIGSGDPTKKDLEEANHKVSDTITDIAKHDNTSTNIPSISNVSMPKNSDIETLKRHAEEESKKATPITKIGDYVHPLGDPNRTIVSAFGPRTLDGKRRLHSGIDLRGNLGDSVYAIKDGTVIYADGRWGFVRIKHNDGSVSGYMHLHRMNVKVGDEVKAGQVIGIVGARGPSGPNTYKHPHLHFDYQLKMTKGEDPFGNGNKVDPIRALSLDPNNLKLSPKSQAKENIDYLLRNADMKAKVSGNISSTVNVDKVNIDSKGGVDMEMTGNDSKLGKVLEDLVSSIKGMHSLSGINTSDSASKSDIATIKILNSINTTMTTVAQLIATQLEQTNKLISVIGSLKVDPSEFDDFNSTRLSTSF